MKNHKEEKFSIKIHTGNSLKTDIIINSIIDLMKCESKTELVEKQKFKEVE